MKTSDKGVDFIVYWEGPYYEQPYEDMGGFCTIGYGHRLLNPNGNGCSGAVKKFYRANPDHHLAHKIS